MGTCTIQIPGSSIPLIIGKKLSSIEIRRLKRQYIKLASEFQLDSVKQLRESFIAYVNNNVQY